MAEPKEAPAPKRVAVVSPEGQFGTMDEADIARAPKGTRVLSRQEQAEQAEDERYDALPAAQKVLGGITTAANVLAGPLAIGSAANAPPTVAAYGAGVRSGLSAGLSDAGTRKIADYVGGKEAGDRYAQQVDEQREASPIAHGVGSVLGLTGGALLGGEAGAATKLLPGAGIGAAGNLAEEGASLAGRALGYTGKTALGRAAMSAAELGARGAVEGGIYGAAESAGDAVLHDVDNATDKIFAATGTGMLYGGLGGAALGAAGSLAKSAIAPAFGGLSRAMKTPDMGEAASAVQSGEAGKAQTSWLRKQSNEWATDALGSTKGQMEKALERVAPTLPEAKQAVGDYVNRIGIGKAVDGAEGLAGAWKAGMGGRADDMLTVIQQDKAGRISQGLESALKAAPARVDMGEVIGHAAEIRQSMMSNVAQRDGAEKFWNRVTNELGAFGPTGSNTIGADGAIDALSAFRARSDMAKGAYELRRDNSAAGDAYKEFLRRFDRMTIASIDKAAAAVGKADVGKDILHWKREWQLASAAEDMAEGGAARVGGNNFLGLREGTAALTGIATGHGIAGVATGIGFKIAKERGKAVAAYGLGKLADRAELATRVAKVDEQIGRASKGLLAAPSKGVMKGSMPATKELAKTALVRAAEFQGDPEAFIDKATRDVAPIATHSPDIANALVARQVQAAQFLASKVPVMPDPDPLDPHPAPRMTPNEEATLGRYAWYTEKPGRFFEEVARGKVTFEGAETAQALAPKAFEQLQQQTLDQLATMKARGNKIPFRQQQFIGILMDIAATPSQRPDHARFLQANVTQDLPPQPDPKPGPPPVPKLQPLDRIESGQLGR